MKTYQFNVDCKDGGMYVNYPIQAETSQLAHDAMRQVLATDGREPSRMHWTQEPTPEERLEMIRQHNPSMSVEDFAQIRAWFMYGADQHKPDSTSTEATCHFRS